MLERTYALVDLDAAAANMREIKKWTNGHTQIMAVVKADAYGHGAIPMSRVFLENGADRLYTLKEKGLGAIYLGSSETDYTLKSAASGQVNGQIRRSGVFLYENGMAGTIAHVDMAKRAYEAAM